jgi:RecB family exonuclease
VTIGSISRSGRADRRDRDSLRKLTVLGMKTGH